MQFFDNTVNIIIPDLALSFIDKQSGNDRSEKIVSIIEEAIRCEQAWTRFAAACQDLQEHREKMYGVHETTMECSADELVSFGIIDVCASEDRKEVATCL
jgi:hypothetical protein